MCTVRRCSLIEGCDTWSDRQMLGSTDSKPPRKVLGPCGQPDKTILDAIQRVRSTPPPLVQMDAGTQAR